MVMFKNGSKKLCKIQAQIMNINLKNIKIYQKNIKIRNKLTNNKIYQIKKMLQLQNIKNQENNANKNNLTAKYLKHHIKLIKALLKVKLGTIFMKWLPMNH